MISSTTNAKIKQVRALQTQRRARDAEHLFVLEGQRLLEEVLRAAVPAQLVLHTGRLLQAAFLFAHARLLRSRALPARCKNYGGAAAGTR